MVVAAIADRIDMLLRFEALDRGRQVVWARVQSI